MKKSAIFSDDRAYRYVLERRWRDDGPMAMCIGLNPSTANEDEDDPTIKSLTRILGNLGYGGFYMTNLFALVSPYPEDLRKSTDPIKDNNMHLLGTRDRASDVIFCWGAFPMAEYRAKLIRAMFPGSWCFGQNQNGSPKHPLYLKSTAELRKFN